MYFRFYISTFSSKLHFALSSSPLAPPWWTTVVDKSNQIQLFCSWRGLLEPIEQWWPSVFLQGNMGPWIMTAYSVLFCLRASSSSCPITHTGGAWPACEHWGRLSPSSTERSLQQGAPITDSPHLRVLKIWKDPLYTAFPWMSSPWQGHLKVLTMRFLCSLFKDFFAHCCFWDVSSSKSALVLNIELNIFGMCWPTQ